MLSINRRGAPVGERPGLSKRPHQCHPGYGFAIRRRARDTKADRTRTPRRDCVLGGDVFGELREPIMRV